MNLSANTLFHFTPKEEYLLNIIEKGFLQRYSTEDYNFLYSAEASRENHTPSAGIPMTCFCDIRLTQTEYHSNKYGSYAIGLTKKWGIRNQVTPILYHHANSHTTLGMKDALDRVFALTKWASRSGEPGIEEIIKETWGIFHSVTDFFKPIEGFMTIRGNKEYVYFYDEREWRYVPPIGEEHLSDIEPYLIASHLNSDVKQKEEEKLHSAHQLLFEEEDVKYIIVPGLNDIEPFQQKLKQNLKRLKYDALLHKIRSYEEFKMDS